jgi:NADH-quinone oxidoreductase subunit A
MNMDWSWLLSPPVAFLIVLGAAVCVFAAFSSLSPRKGRTGAGAKPYACGEETPVQKIRVDYSQFFPFAFFFTILHVVALMAATLQVGTIATLCIALIYVLGGFIGLTVLYRR